MEPSSPYTAAWGNPAIVLRCGVPPPAELRPASSLLAVNDVDWLPVSQPGGGVVFTTTGRAAYVEVSVPKDYTPEAHVLVDLAAPVTDSP